MHNKTRVDFLRDQFNSVVNYGIKYEYFAQNVDGYYDQYFTEFSETIRNDVLADVNIKSKTFDDVFDFFLETDPTKNKEYVSWIISLYKNILKKSVAKIKGELDLMKQQALLDEYKKNNRDHYLFYEDLYSSVNTYLSVYNEYKKRNIIKLEYRDINKFKDYNSFVNYVHGFNASEELDVVLNSKELKSIANFKNGGRDKNDGLAELCFEDDNYFIVITHDKISNQIFGEQSTLCTASKGPRNAFDSYNNLGKLFVVIRKNKQNNKQDRYQLHFEKKEFKDLSNNTIDIIGFFNSSPKIKTFFTKYIIENIVPKMDGFNELVEYFKYFGIIGDLFEVLIQSKDFTKLNISKYKLTREMLLSISKITQLVELNISECDINELPIELSNLKELKRLVCRYNPDLKEIPKEFANMTNLEIVDFCGCDIKYFPDIEKNLNITELILDNNYNLSELPKNINKLSKLKRLSVSNCNLTKIDDEILLCEKLVIIDAHDNVNLKNIPVKIGQIPNIMAVCLDNTAINSMLINLIKSNKNDGVTIIKYG